MNKLDQISKKHPFQVPEGYFDRLPLDIQSRIAERSSQPEAKPYFKYALQYALPLVVLMVVAFFYLKPAATENADTLLASVSTEELMAYLEETDISTDELLETLPLDAENADALESEVYFNFDLEGNSLDEMNIEIENL